MIPYGRQSISEQDIQAVIEVLRSDCLTQGVNINAFERAVADYCGAESAIAVSSGTAALHLACRAIGFGPGDILWTSPNTFVASANCAIYCGGEVDFVDIDPRSYNLCVDALEQKLCKAESEDRLPKVVVPVHFSGQSCDMKRIRELSRQYGFYVIEDACHALGGRYNNIPIGSCQYSDLTVFSFHPLKSITTGEGGMVLSNDKRLHQRLSLLRSHGVSKESKNFKKPAEGSWYYEQQELGYNYRMTDMQAALGRSQLQRLDDFIARRNELAQRYDEALRNLPINTPWQDPNCYSARHLYPITFHGGAEKRRYVYDSLRDAGIQTQVHYIPVHTQPFYRERGFENAIFPNAEAYYAGALSLPLYTSMSLEDQDHVLTHLKEALQ
jgi:UDP-4-amino-4,6-dideoxy-N-acetyl-beta-L-altrosamine transaminase